MAITEATGNFALEAGPLLEINNTASTVHKLFIYLVISKTLQFPSQAQSNMAF
jgi:hypothetical protein